MNTVKIIGRVHLFLLEMDRDILIGNFLKRSFITI